MASTAVARERRLQRYQQARQLRRGSARSTLLRRIRAQWGIPKDHPQPEELIRIHQKLPFVNPAVRLSRMTKANRLKREIAAEGDRFQWRARFDTSKVWVWNWGPEERSMCYSSMDAIRNYAHYFTEE